MTTFFRRSPTAFVQRVGCEKRKEILRCEHIALDLAEQDEETGNYEVLPSSGTQNSPSRQWSWYKAVCRLLGGATLVASIIWELHELGGTWTEFGWSVMERDPHHQPRWFELTGFILFFLAALMQLWRSVCMHRIFGCVSSGIIGVGMAGLVISKCIGGPDTVIGQISRLQTDVRAAGILGFYSSTVTVLGFVTLQIFYKSFAGLFAPLAPSIHAPTIMPIFLMQSLAAITHAISLGLVEFQIHPPDLYLHRSPIDTILALRCASYALYLLVGWGELNIVYVAQTAFKRRIYRKQLYQDRLYRQ